MTPANKLRFLKEPDLSALSPASRACVREWLSDGTFVERAIGTMLDQERELRAYEKLKEQERYGYVVTDTRGMQYFYKDTPYLDTAVECQDVFTHPAPEATVNAQLLEALKQLVSAVENSSHLDARRGIMGGSFDKAYAAIKAAEKK